MDATYVWIAALLAGIGVVVATTAASRLSGAWAGILATLPVTPTSGILVLGSAVDGTAALRGLATIAAVLLVIVALLALRVLQGRVGIVVGLAVIAPLAFLIDQMPLVLVGATAMVSLFACQIPLAHGAVAAASPPRIAWPLRFAVGAGSVALVAGSEILFPGFGVLLAMMPVLFVTSLAVVLFEQGSAVAVGMLRGGVAGCAGMVAFVSAYAVGWHEGVPVLLALGLAWVAFAAIALAWRRVQQRPRPGPVGA